MRNMMKLISVVLVLTMVMMLGGCGASQKDALLGTWEATLDLTEMMNEEMQMDEEMAEYITVSDFSLKMVMTFNEDDTYSMNIDKASVEAAMESMMGDLEAGMTKYFEDMLTEMGMTDVSVDDLLAEMGMSMDQLMEESYAAAMEEEDLFGELDAEGNFKVKDGKIFLSDGKDYAVDENVYDTYTLENGVLTLTETVDPDMDDETAKFVEAMYPIAFLRLAD